MGAEAPSLGVVLSHQELKRELCSAVLTNRHSLTFGDRYFTRWAFTGGEPWFTHEFAMQIETKTGITRVMYRYEIWTIKKGCALKN